MPSEGGSGGGGSSRDLKCPKCEHPLVRADPESDFYRCTGREAHGFLIFWPGPQTLGGPIFVPKDLPNSET